MNPSFSVIAGTLYGNRGAELMLSVVVGQLRDRYPGARCNIYSYMVEDDRRECTDNDAAIYSASPMALVLLLFPGALVFGALRKLFGTRVLRLAPAPIRALGESACLFDVAGVSFIDGREKFLPFNVLTLWPAMLLGVPVIKLSQAMGPIRSPLNRLAARLTLPRCHQLWARGEGTYNNLMQSGLPGLAVDRADDLAFLYQDRYCLSRRAPQAVAALRQWCEGARGSARAVVGVCPSAVLGSRKVAGGAAYEARLAALVSELIADGYAVFLFPNATRTRAGDRERNNDLPLIRRIAGRVGGEISSGQLHCVLDDVNASDIGEAVAMAEVLLVSRFHAMVAALAHHRAVIVLGWSHKYAEVMQRFGLADLVHDHKQAAVVPLPQLVGEVCARRGEIEAGIRKQMDSVVTASARQFELPDGMSETRP